MSRRRELDERRTRLSPERALLFERRLAGARARSPGPTPRSSGEPAPLSFSQDRLWRWAEAHPGRADHNLYHVLALAGPLDRATLAAALSDVVRRHPILAGRFAHDPETGRGIALPPAASTPALTHLDLTRTTGPTGGASERQRLALDVVLALARPAFDLSAEAPARWALLALDDELHALALVAHHAVVDAHSLELLRRDLGEAYRRRLTGGEPLGDRSAGSALDAGDLAAWERRRLDRGDLSHQLDWWRRQLDDAPTEVAWDSTTGGNPGSTDGFRRQILLPDATAEALRALARKHETTLFTVAVAALASAVSSMAAGDELVVGTPFALRQRPEAQGVVGHLLNLVPLRIDLSAGPTGEPTFAELVERVRRVTDASFAAAEVPVERLVEELAPEAFARGEVPWVQVHATLLPGSAGTASPAGSAPTESGGDGLRIVPSTTGEIGSELDLTCHVRDFEATTRDLRIDLGFSGRVFDHAGADRLAARLEQVLARAGGTEATAPGTETRLDFVETPDAAERIVVVGAGLVGTFAALTLARRGYRVDVYERRPDLRDLDLPAGRSINITLAQRGFTALERMGVGAAVREICVPLTGRMMHDTDGRLTEQPYGSRGEAIHSVSRNDLNRVLVEQAEGRGGIRFHFLHHCLEVDQDGPSVVVQQEGSGASERVEAAAVLAADGAFSSIRRQLQQTPRFDFSQRFVAQGYKELQLPPEDDGSWPLDPKFLHLWPRGAHMLIGFPNVDRSFTLALHLPFEGELSLASCQTEDDLRALFARDFPDVAERIPALAESFFSIGPTAMVTVRCSPWIHGERVALIGDAAHAVVPSYGQGANCGFEDCLVLDRCLDEAGGDLPAALARWERARKPNADAIADLSLAHFDELQEHVADPLFLLRKQIERRMEELYPERFMPLYSMVSFTDLTYVEALVREAAQKSLVDHLMDHTDIEDLASSEGLESLIDELVASPAGQRLEPFSFERGAQRRETGVQS